WLSRSGRRPAPTPVRAARCGRRARRPSRRARTAPAAGSSPPTTRARPAVSTTAVRFCRS
ncbi:MAG: LSU ribosomal protein L32p @ LSU ribosomal protein L32p, zinc-dependent, partial [uncultured Blastococcus sp.]